MKRLWVKLASEGDYLICPDRDSAKVVYVAFNIILEVPIGDRTQKWHFGIHCLNVRLSRAKPLGAGPTILGVSPVGVKIGLCGGVRCMTALPPRTDIRRHA